jgi:diguanylate cyclase (GGDEF)-like protein
MVLPHAVSAFGCVTVSIGVAVMVPAEGQSEEDLLKQADLALYRAKAQGRNQAVLVPFLAQPPHASVV